VSATSKGYSRGSWRDMANVRIGKISLSGRRTSVSLGKQFHAKRRQCREERTYFKETAPKRAVVPPELAFMLDSTAEATEAMITARVGLTIPVRLAEFSRYIHTAAITARTSPLRNPACAGDRFIANSVHQDTKESRAYLVKLGIASSRLTKPYIQAAT